jgi:hypothetical protein
MMKLTPAVATAVAAAALMAQSSVFAGQSSGSTVVVGSTYAYGSLKAARNSSDTKQYIGCAIGAQPGQTPGIQCSAQNASGTSIYCADNAPSAAAIAMVSGINDSSYVYFVADSNHNCSYIVVYNYSYNL